MLPKNKQIAMVSGNEITGWLSLTILCTSSKAIYSQQLFGPFDLQSISDILAKSTSFKIIPSPPQKKITPAYHEFT